MREKLIKEIEVMLNDLDVTTLIAVRNVLQNMTGRSYTRKIVSAIAGFFK